MTCVDVVEAGIADLRAVLESGRATSEALLRAYRPMGEPARGGSAPAPRRAPP